ncbi:hypothetical protein V8B97DRAFT_2041323 [Scleroderma yunnanense]
MHARTSYKYPLRRPAFHESTPKQTPKATSRETTFVCLRNPHNCSGTVLPTNSWQATVDELDAARVELARLEQKERQLLKDLLDVRAAADAQRTTIDILVEARRPTIANFPTDVLVRIFTLYLDPLNLIEVRIPSGHELSANLVIIIPSANRWNSLVVDSSSLAFFILLTNHLKFPSLRYVDIDGDRGIWNVDFISATRSPALESLNLGVTYDLPKLPQLKTLNLSIYSTSRLSPSLFVQSLTTLTLMGNIEGWLLERDCISLPVLRTLNLCLTKARHFMEAIIAPRLEYFDYSSDSPDSIEFGVLRNKFSTVHHLSLLRQENANCGMALCEALPGIRCVEVRADSVLEFAQP